MEKIKDSELILNADGSIFHLHLKPENIGDTILLLGDQGRVAEVSKYFDEITFKVQNREFCTHTGTLRGKKITALSTGIGTDNIDIVINELDALVNIDLENRTIKKEHKALNLIRIGTSGALQEDIPVDSFVISSHGFGMDGLLHFYQSEKFRDLEIEKEIINQCNWPNGFNRPYVVKAPGTIYNTLKEGMFSGITGTACGFYGPQGRKLRLGLQIDDLNERLTNFKMGNTRITNFEMETSALYGLSALLGHNAATCCAIIANRIAKQYSSNYKLAVDKLIQTVLNRVC
jgi:uridine phosphorylase